MKIRADLVCETTLAKVAGRLQLGRYLLLGHGEEQGRPRRESILPMQWNRFWQLSIWTAALQQPRIWFTG